MTRYFTITGTNYRLGTDFLEKGMKVRLEKDPENEYDTEAIKVTMPGLKTIGMVANSVRTVLGECYSAGRLYDKIGDEAEGEVMYVLNGSVVCSIELPD
ncbi:MAG: DNA-binding protein [Parasporobacterium sp.]|nr:DNA-binding protein [Parasporobacterium sp.]